MYLLRYHEEMNELAVDAQLELPSTNTDGSNAGCGEIWCISGCPVDPTLVVTCTGSIHVHDHNNNNGTPTSTGNTSTGNTTATSGAAETILWRMPKEALGEEDLDYYTNNDEHENVHSGVLGEGEGEGGMGRHHSSSLTPKSVSSAYIASTGGGHASAADNGNANFIMEKVAHLNFSNHAKSNDTNHNANTDPNRCPYILRGRVSDMHWNPECIPDNVNDSLFNPSYDRHDHIDHDHHHHATQDQTSHHTATSPKAGLGIGTSGPGGPNFLTVEYGTSTVTTWDLRTSAAIPIDRITVPTPTSHSTPTPTHAYSCAPCTPPKASWDPHNTNLIAVTTGRDVALIDVRCSASAGDGGGGGFVGGMQSCHRFGVMDVDHNPNVPHLLTTCGQDGLVKFWDVRKGMGRGGGGSAGMVGSGVVESASMVSDTSQARYDGGGGSGWTMENPLRTVRGGHTHWTTVVKYNSFHDQLLLSGGTDGMVNLWRISSISSAPMMLDCGVEGGGGGGGNGGVGGGGRGMEGDQAEDDDLARFLTYRDQDEDGGGDDDGDSTGVHEVGDDERAPPHTNNGSTSDRQGTNSIDGDGGDKPDVRVTKMELSEAVYDLAWSAADPWIFVSLGFDGSVVLNHVPSKEKYKILL